MDEVRGGAIPTEYIPAVEKGFRHGDREGPLIGFPVTGVRVVVNDGESHSVDSSDMAFQIAGRKAFREAYPKARPVVLEPVMKLEVESPAEFQGAVLKTVMQRRGTVVGTTEEDGFCRVEAEVPLSEMFGYATDLRSARRARPSSRWSSPATCACRTRCRTSSGRSTARSWAGRRRMTG